MSRLSVIKVGGALLEDPQSLSSFLEGFAALPGPKILVHGGGRTATAVAKKLGIESRMVSGRRVTDEKMLEVVLMVYAGLVNKTVVAKLQAKGLKALGLCGADLGVILADRRPPVRIGEEIVDFGCVGDVRKADAAALKALIDLDIVPVIAPLSCDGQGNLLNTNADSIASFVACAMSAVWGDDGVELKYCFEKEGVLGSDGGVIPKIYASDFQRLEDDGTVSGGMLPKLQSAFAALSAGVRQVRITSADNLDGGTLIL